MAEQQEVEIELEGFLKKRKGDNKKPPPSEKTTLRLTTRWAILLAGTLHLYKQNTDLQPNRSIDLGEVELEINVANKQHLFCFALKKEKFYYILCASTTEEHKRWTSAIQSNMKKSPSKPPTRRNHKGVNLSTKAKTNLGGKMAGTNAGKTIISKMMNEDSSIILENLKIFAAKESGDKFAEDFYTKVIKLSAKIGILCSDGALKSEDFWIPAAKAVRVVFSKLIDSFELSFAFDPEGLACDIREVEVIFEKIFSPLLSTKNIQTMKGLFDYFASEEILQKFYTEEKYRENVTCVVKTLRKLWNSINFPEVVKQEKV